MAPGAMGLSHAQNAVQYGDNGEALLSAAQQRVLDKQSEWEGFLKLLRQTEVQQRYMTELADKTNLMSDGTAGESWSFTLHDCNAIWLNCSRCFAVVGKVVSNWQNIFRATHLALSSS